MKGDRFKAGTGGGVDPDGDPSVAQTVKHIYYIQGKQGSVQLILVGYPRSGVEWSTGMKKLLVKTSSGIAAKLTSAGTQKPGFSKHPSLGQQ